LKNTENYLVSASVSAYRGLKSGNTSDLGTEGPGLHKLPSSMQSKAFNIVKIKPHPFGAEILALCVCLCVCYCCIEHCEAKV